MKWSDLCHGLVVIPAESDPMRMTRFDLRRPFSLSLLAILVACVAPAEAPRVHSPVIPGTIQDSSGQAKDSLWRLPVNYDRLRDTSCPPGSRPLDPLPIDLTASPVSLGEAGQIARRIPQSVNIAGAWELSSSHANFGGLSGLALIPEAEGGGLLAVTDAGAFVWLDLEDGAPASAQLAYMQGLDGSQYTGKSAGDAEGLVYWGGLALVSFERDFRIEAFALAACGGNARGAPVAALPDRYGNRSVDVNQGPEALFLTPDGALGFGYEGMLGTSPIGRVLADGSAEWTGETAPAPLAHGLVGMEQVAMPDGSVRTLQLFRAWDPLQGNRIRLVWGEGEEDSLSLARPLLVDNFEGIAAEATGTGLRVWIVSDDNFSPRQRTLLFVFDISLGGG